MHSISDLRDRLNTDDHRLWLLIGLCVAVILTIEVVEEAVEGVWPHQRRMSGMDIGQQRAHQIWALVALLVLPAAILATMNVGMMVWKDTPTTDGIRTGAALLAIGWGSFLTRQYRSFATAQPREPGWAGAPCYSGDHSDNRHCAPADSVSGCTPGYADDPRCDSRTEIERLIIDYAPT